MQFRELDELTLISFFFFEEEWTLHKFDMADLAGASRLFKTLQR